MASSSCLLRRGVVGAHAFRSAAACCALRMWVPTLRLCGSALHTKQQTTSLFTSLEALAPIANARDLPSDHVKHSPLSAAAAASPATALTMSPKRMILVDGNAVLCRAYYKLMSKTSDEADLHPDADWVLTVFTALTTILGLLELQPTHILAVFDYRGLTFRHSMFPEYKKNRPETPEAIVKGLDYIRPALVSMGIKVLEVPGVEADDVIATVATTVASPQLKVRIVSPDKDFFQILSPHIRLFRFPSKGSEMNSFGMEEFVERFGGLQPSQFADVLSLVGDTCDNIPGIKGIGEKTAIRLITEYGSVENLLKNRENVTIKRAIKGLLADKGEALLSKRLVVLRSDLPFYLIPFGLDDYALQKPHDDGHRFFDLLKAMSCMIDSKIHIEMQARTLELWKTR